jgi:hypothetical protein
MRNKNNLRKINILVFLLCSILLQACKKEEKQETVVKFRCFMPHNNQPIAGCKVSIAEAKAKKAFSLMATNQ